MSELESEEMERQRRQEDSDRQKRESRYLAIIVGHALGLLVMLGFYWAILQKLETNQIKIIETVNKLDRNQAGFAPTIQRADRFIDRHQKEHLEYWKNKK